MSPAGVTDLLASSSTLLWGGAGLVLLVGLVLILKSQAQQQMETSNKSKIAPDPTQRRDTFRVPLNFKAEISPNELVAPFTGDVMDLSVGGFSVIVTQTLPLQTLCTVSIMAPEETLEQLPLVVLKVSDGPAPGTTVLHCRFTDLPSGAEQSLQRILAERQRQIMHPEDPTTP